MSNAPDDFTHAAPAAGDPGVPEVYERSWVLAQLGDDEELLKEVIEVFLADVPRHEQELSRALASGEPAPLRAAAHSIKSAVGNFGARNAHTASQALEDACVAGRHEVFRDLTHDVLREVTTLKRFLSEDLARFT